MLQSRHFAGKPLIGKGLKEFSDTLHCGTRYFPAHHLGVQWQNSKQESNGRPRAIQFGTSAGQAIIASVIFRRARRGFAKNLS
jgi:hypothetical protein